MQEKFTITSYVIVFLALIIGFIHLSLIAYQHIGVLPEFIFFLLTGFVQIAWVFLFIRNQDDSSYYLGLVIHGGVAAMWLLTRLLPAPFVNTPEPVDTLGMSIFLFELLVIIGLAVWHHQKEHVHMFSIKQFGMLLSIPIIAGSLMFSGAHVSANTVFSSIEVGNHSHGGGGSNGHKDRRPHPESAKGDEENHIEPDMKNDEMHQKMIDDSHADADDHHD